MAAMRDMGALCFERLGCMISGFKSVGSWMESWTDMRGLGEVLQDGA